jgi:hypothetical protein
LNDEAFRIEPLKTDPNLGKRFVPGLIDTMAPGCREDRLQRSRQIGYP